MSTPYNPAYDEDDQDQAAASTSAAPVQTSIRQMRASVERLEGENYRLTRQAKAERIDLGLALLSLANPPGEERQALSAYDIAAWCGCTHSAIQSIERRALRKLQRRFAALLRGQVIHGDFAEADTTLLRPSHPLAAAA